MGNVRRPAGLERHHVAGRARRRAGRFWLGVLLVACGWMGIGLSHVVVEASDDRASGVTVFWSTALVVAPIAAIGVGGVIVRSAALSPERHVFHSRPLLRVAGSLLVVAAVASFFAIRSNPFGGLAAQGKPLSELIVGLGTIAAAIVCLVGCIVALQKALEERRVERGWGRPQPS